MRAVWLGTIMKHAKTVLYIKMCKIRKNYNAISIFWNLIIVATIFLREKINFLLHIYQHRTFVELIKIVHAFD